MDSTVTVKRRVERWARQHANGWRSEVVRDENGDWCATAYPDCSGGTFSRVHDFAFAQAVAESRVPVHQCSSQLCGPWQPADV